MSPCSLKPLLREYVGLMAEVRPTSRYFEGPSTPPMQQPMLDVSLLRCWLIPPVRETKTPQRRE
jgi:hypothetical protein